MTVTLLPDQERVVSAAIDAGVIRSVEDLINAAIAHLPPAVPLAEHAAQAANLVDLFEPLRGLFTEDEIASMFSRNPSAGRPVELS